MKLLLVVNSKGGTGKTLVAWNLATSFGLNHKVGILDADLDNPNLPYLLNIDPKKMIGLDEGRTMLPIQYDGVKVFSLDFFFRVPLKGPSATRRLGLGISKTGEEKKQIIKDAILSTDWGDTDLLILDMPGGTGEEFQAIREVGSKLKKGEVLGCIIVTQPNVLQPVERIVDLCGRFEIRVLGLVENMSGHTCPNCGYHTEPFGMLESKELAEGYGMRFFGRIPIDERVKENPLVVQDSEPIINVVQYVEELLNGQTRR